MRYGIHDLCYITTLVVPSGGPADLDIKPGQSVVVAGGAAVTMALALGVEVIAAGTNKAQLKSMENILGAAYGGRLTFVKLTGSVEADAQSLQQPSPGDKGIAYIDFSPAIPAKSMHIKSRLIALKTHGKASFMGGIREEVSIPYDLLMIKSLMIKGRFVYDRQAIVQLVGMVEAGVVKLGKEAGVEIVGAHKLEDIRKALDVVAENPGFGKEVVLTP